MNTFALFGNPIKHSRSPEIYALFAKEFGISTEYKLILALKENFDNLLYNFFKLDGGLGANITIPFKERVVSLCDQCTDRAKIAKSVNTIKKMNNGVLLGDNTDGIGFISDLERIGWIDKKNNMINNKKIFFQKNNNILLIGTGGAAKGIIPMLLNRICNCHVYLVNRTFIRAVDLVNYYHGIGYKNISCLPIHELFNRPIRKYTLIINATASSMKNVKLDIPSFLINDNVKCYDLYYQDRDTLFISWCKEYGAIFCADGLGMLVEQAAYAFYLWHNFFPDTSVVVDCLRSRFKK